MTAMKIIATNAHMSHQKAFDVILNFIHDHIIDQHEVLQMSYLRGLYIQELEKNGYPNPDYRTEKLKSRLVNDDVHKLIAFTNVTPGDNGCVTYNLRYSASMSVADAVTFAYKLGSKDQHEDVAMFLRIIIQQAFKPSKPLPWPPTADDLEVESPDELLPPDFLNFVISGDADVEKCEKTKWLVFSLGQVNRSPPPNTLTNTNDYCILYWVVANNL